MEIGFNYAWAYNQLGSQIGPNIWASESDWRRFEVMAASGQVDRIPLPPMFDHVDRNLAVLRSMGVTVVRWFLLGNGNNYGPPPTPVCRDIPHRSVAPEHRLMDASFSPPAVADPRFARDFRELLLRFTRAGMRIVPSLISFEFSSLRRFTSGKNGTAACGRADVLRDPTARSRFFDTLLSDLLRVSVDFRNQIYAFEVVNEPVWMITRFGANSYPTPWVDHEPEVTAPQLTEFLSQAITRIEAAKLSSTVGHRHFAELSSLPAGNRPQFHYYADNSAARAGLEIIDPANKPDPWRVDDPTLFQPLRGAGPAPFLGEIGSDHNVDPSRPWSHELLSSADQTLVRLGRLATAGCPLAMMWPDTGDSGTDDRIKLQVDTAAAIASFTGGVAPAADRLFGGPGDPAK